MTRFARRSVALTRSVGCFHAVGGIEVAATPERWEELDRRYGRGLSFGLQPSLLSPAEVAEKLPLVDPERILGGLFVPDDGIGKALQAAEALGRGAIATGALQAFGDCEVTGLDTGGGRVRAVHTSRGTIRADHVVLAAGIWGPRVMRLAGRRLPLHPVEHIYALTEPLPELRGAQGEISDPILRHQDRSMYLRQVGETYGIGSYLHPPLLCAAEEIAPSGPGAHPSERAFTPEHFAAAREEAGPPAAGAARRPAGARLQRAHVLHPRRHAAHRRAQRDARAVAVRGDLGDARRRRGRGARRPHGPRRGGHRPARVRPGALRRPRAVPRVRPRSRGAAVPRGLRRHPPARAGARRATAARQPVPRAPGRARRRDVRERRLGAPAVVPGGGDPRRAGAQRVERAVLGAGGARRAPGDPRARRAVRPLPLHEDHGARPRGARVPAAPRRQRRRPAARDDRLHRDAHAGRSDHVRPHRHAGRRGGVLRRHRRRGRQARPRLDAPPPAAGRLGRADGRDVAPVLPRAVGPARAGRPRRDRRGRHLRRRLPVHGDARAARRAGPRARAAHLLRRRAGLGDLRAAGVRPRAVGRADRGGRAARPRALRRRGLRLPAPGEGLPAVGGRHRRGARPLGGGPGLRREARQGRLPRSRGRRAREGARWRDGSAA